jgi:hypothetical protein
MYKPRYTTEKKQENIKQSRLRGRSAIITATPEKQETENQLIKKQNNQLGIFLLKGKKVRKSQFCKDSSEEGSGTYFTVRLFQ